MEDKFNYNVIVDELQPGYYDGHEILYTDKRIERSSIPAGMYLYELRGERNDISIPCEIRHSVLIRFSGSIITKEPLPMSEKGSLPIQDNDHQLLILNHLLDGIETDDEDEDVTVGGFFDMLSEAGIIPYIQEKDENGKVISERPMTKEEFIQYGDDEE